MSEGSLTGHGVTPRSIFGSIDANTRSMINSAAGLAAVILGILGLATLRPSLLAAITTIVASLSILLLGLSLVRRYLALIETSNSTAYLTGGEGGGIAIGIVGGAAGAILGILALLDIARLTLVAIAVILLGATLILGSTSGTRLDRLEASQTSVAPSAVAHLAAATTSLAQALVGIAGVVLGILALLLPSAVTLELIALLAFGAVVLLSSPYSARRILEFLTEF